MIPIETIRKHLETIPGALLAEGFDSSERPPGIGGNNLEHDSFWAHDLNPLFDLGEFEYPEWAKKEVFGHLDEHVLDGGNREAPGFYRGTDALAWYVSYHHSKVDWGVFIPVSSLAYLECVHFSNVDLDRGSKWRLAFQLLLDHELFHFAADYMAGQWEILMGLPCWRELRDRKLAARRYLEIEEALANAYMLQRIQRLYTANSRRAVRAFIGQQPPGYRHALDIIDRGAFNEQLSELSKTYAGLGAIAKNLDTWSDVFDHRSFFPFVGNRKWATCPVHVWRDEQILDVPNDAIRLVQSIEEVQETRKFRKSLDGMSHEIVKKWNKQKERLKARVPSAPRFKRLTGHLKGIYSLWIDRNFRAHLRYENASKQWQAIDIGTHKELGHG